MLIEQFDYTNKESAIVMWLELPELYEPPGILIATVSQLPDSQCHQLCLLYSVSYFIIYFYNVFWIQDPPKHPLPHQVLQSSTYLYAVVAGHSFYEYAFRHIPSIFNM